MKQSYVNLLAYNYRYRKMITSKDGMIILGGQYGYNPKQTIGKGSFATVYKGIEIKTGKIVAVKVCAIQKMEEDQQISLQKQIHIMKQLNHPNIVDFYGVYQDNKNIYLILEYLQGGQLYEHILQKQYYSEQQAKKILVPIIDAVRYLHQSGIIHRDLKPENIVFTMKEGVQVVKIIDFGVSQIITNETVMSTAIGTLLYMAPEIFMGFKYRAAVDIWSIGVILYILMCGYPPFQSENPVQLQHQIKQAEIGFDQNDWAEVSQPAKDLVRRMLQRKPQKRITMPQILKHPWIVNDVPDKNMQNAKLKLQNAFKKIKNIMKAINLMKK